MKVKPSMPWYTTDRLSQKEIDELNKFYEKNMSCGSGKYVIQEYLQKADFVPVYLEC